MSTSSKLTTTDKNSLPGFIQRLSARPSLAVALIGAYSPMLITGAALAGALNFAMLPVLVCINIAMALVILLFQTIYSSIWIYHIHHLLKRSSENYPISPRKSLILGILLNPLTLPYLLALQLAIVALVISLTVTALQFARATPLVFACFAVFFSLVIAAVCLTNVAGVIYWNMRWTSTIANFLNGRPGSRKISKITPGLTLLTPAMIGLIPCFGISEKLAIRQMICLFIYMALSPLIGFLFLRWIEKRITEVCPPAISSAASSMPDAPE